MFALLVGVALVTIGNASGPAKDRCDSQSLRVAASSGRLNALRLCLDRGSSSDSPTPEGVTLLMIAAAKGQEDAVRLLIERSANVNARTKNDGITPLMFAAALGQLPALKVLVELGKGDLTLKDQGGRRTVVEWAAAHSAVKSLSNGEDEATAEAASHEILIYLKTKGAVIRETDIVQGILMFASPPDLVRLLNDSLSSDISNP